MCSLVNEYNKTKETKIVSGVAKILSLRADQKEQNSVVRKWSGKFQITFPTREGTRGVVFRAWHSTSLASAPLLEESLMLSCFLRCPFLLPHEMQVLQVGCRGENKILHMHKSWHSWICRSCWRRSLLFILFIFRKDRPNDLVKTLGRILSLLPMALVKKLRLGEAQVHRQERSGNMACQLVLVSRLRLALSFCCSMLVPAHRTGRAKLVMGFFVRWGHVAECCRYCSLHFFNVRVASESHAIIACEPLDELLRGATSPSKPLPFLALGDEVGHVVQTPSPYALGSGSPHLWSHALHKCPSHIPAEGQEYVQLSPWQTMFM